MPVGGDANKGAVIGRLVQAGPLARLWPSTRTSLDSKAFPLHGLTVLLVEDSRFTADAIRLICLRAGGRLKRAETLGQAAAHLQTYRPDVVIVDMSLPDGAGEDLIRSLFQQPDAPPILAISGDPERAETARQSGATAFVVKPIVTASALLQGIVDLLPTPSATIPDDATVAELGDAMALRDDLEQALHLLCRIPPEDPTYVADFLRGVGRSSGDEQLVAATDIARRHGANWAKVRALLRLRLRDSPLI